MLNFCDFIQVYVFSTNHHLKPINTSQKLFMRYALPVIANPYYYQPAQSVHSIHVPTSPHQLSSLDKNILCIRNVIYSNARRTRERQQAVVSFL